MSSGKGRRRSIKIVPEPLLTVTANKKPTLPYYFRSTQVKFLTKNDLLDERKAMLEKNLAWLTSRMVATKIFNSDVEQNVPGWSTFHSIISAKITTPIDTGNCRSVLSSPTKVSVVYTVLVNIKRMLNNIGQDPALITCDEGVYSLSKEAQWQVVPQLDSVILRLGGFHRAKNFVGVFCWSCRKTNG